MEDAVRNRYKNMTPEELAAWYEESRDYSIRSRGPVISLDFTGLDILDVASPETLPEAADKILVAQAARQAIRAAARLEQAARTNWQNQYYKPTPADELVMLLTRERDRAVAYFYELRQRQAKLAKMEAATSKRARKAAPAAAKGVNDDAERFEPCVPSFLSELRVAEA